MHLSLLLSAHDESGSDVMGTSSSCVCAVCFFHCSTWKSTLVHGPRMPVSVIASDVDCDDSCRGAADKLTDEEREERAQSTYNEYVSSNDLGEAVTCIRELNSAGMCHLVFLHLIAAWPSQAEIHWTEACLQLEACTMCSSKSSCTRAARSLAFWLSGNAASCADRMVATDLLCLS